MYNVHIWIPGSWRVLFCATREKKKYIYMLERCWHDRNTCQSKTTSFLDDFCEKNFEKYIRIKRARMTPATFGNAYHCQRFTLRVYCLGSEPIQRPSNHTRLLLCCAVSWRFGKFGSHFSVVYVHTGTALLMLFFFSPENGLLVCFYG